MFRAIRCVTDVLFLSNLNNEKKSKTKAEKVFRLTYGKIIEQLINMKENQPLNQDQLATKRTMMANDRTLLSYIRTALVVIGPGITILKLFPQDPSLRMIGLICIPISAFIVMAGLISHRNTKKLLDPKNENLVQLPTNANPAELSSVQKEMEPVRANGGN